MRHFKLSIPLTLTCLLSILVSPLASTEEQNKNRLPNMGTAAFSTLSIDKEMQMGEAMMRQLRSSQPVINDPVLTEYINALGNRLVKNAQNVNYSFDFFLINNKEINAFAFFGGHVGVHTGLITTADNESELASVLAHEISHVTQRHLARSLDAQKRNQPLSMAGMISSVLIALVNPSVGFAALTTTMAASQQLGINYTRSNEEEADRVGISLLAASGFDPEAAPAFFEKLSEKYRYTSKPPALLLTHPLPASRVADARNRAQSYPPHTLGPSLSFELAKARIIARYENTPKENVAYFKDRLAQHKYVLKAAAEYGLAVSYLDNKQYHDAEKILVTLHQQDVKNLFYVDALSDVYIGLSQFQPAITMLSRLSKLMPNNQVVALNYANVLTEHKQYQQAISTLQDLLLIQPENFLAHDLLTTIYEKMNNQALRHASKAEVLALLGRYSMAVDELQTAINYTQTHPLLKKRFKARILQLQEQQNKLKRLLPH